jgi:hypothetical protein
MKGEDARLANTNSFGIQGTIHQSTQSQIQSSIISG